MNATAPSRALFGALLLGLAVACGGAQPPVADPSTPSPVATPTPTSPPTPMPAESLTDDRLVLLEMRDALAGTGALNWDNHLPVGNWDGVTIAGSPPRITALDLTDRRLSGAIPPTLGRLAALISLNLSGNRLGGAIPPELGRLAALTALDLGDNRLTGAIPPELGTLAALTALDLGDNRLMGAIPPELGTLAALTALDLGDNRLMGAIPPELGTLAALTTLDLGDNRLMGAIPPELGTLAALTTLDLSGNGLEGVIPPELGGLSALTALDLGGNGLTGAIPPELGALAALTALDLGGNGLTGAIPSELGGLAALTALDLGDNGLTGAIPPELGALAALTALDLSGNRLTGALPSVLPAIVLIPAFPGLPELDEPVGLVEAPEHDLFLVTLREGRVLAIPRDGPWENPRTVHDQRERTSTGNEQGLLSITLDPDFARNGYVYVWYSVRGGTDATRLARLATSGQGAAFAFDASSELTILEIEQPHSNHNGGTLLFGPDGMLYLGVGDGGSQGDPHNHGQNPGTLLGTVIRLDVRGATADAPYAIPPDNPFLDREDARPEIWAWGLRNPWRMSFDRETGILWAGDVGESAVEEIDVVRAGANYGWNVIEGTRCFSPPDGCDRTGLVPPVYEYRHDDGCSVTGGFVYRGVAIPALRGWYLFSDYCKSHIRGIPVARALAGEAAEAGVLWEHGPDFVVSFAEDADGELYVVSHEGARIYRVIADPTANRATDPSP